MTLAELPPEGKPREKLLNQGAGKLTNTELLAVILGKGMPGKDVLSLAGEVVEALAAHTGDLDLAQLLSINGIGPSKACQILASVEFSRRFLLQRRRLRITTPVDALPVLGRLKSCPQEQFMVLTLDGSNALISAHEVTIGLVNQSQIHPRETFRPAIRDQAVSIVLAHNHPSGNLEPSEADLQATARLVQVSKTVGIPILDHLIVAEGGYCSLREKYPGLFT